MVACTCSPATREAEGEESLEPGRWRLQWAEMAPLHSSLGNKSEMPSQKIEMTRMYYVLFIEKLLWSSHYMLGTLNTAYNFHRNSVYTYYSHLIKKQMQLVQRINLYWTSQSLSQTIMSTSSFVTQWITIDFSCESLTTECKILNDKQSYQIN